jgi:hypothetical protein
MQQMYATRNRTLWASRPDGDASIRTNAGGNKRLYAGLRRVRYFVLKAGILFRISCRLPLVAAIQQLRDAIDVQSFLTRKGAFFFFFF